MRAIAILLTALLGGCAIKSHLVECSDEGLLCAAGDVCDAIHHICITPEQAKVCIGVADGTPCTAGTASGICDREVCVPEGCGNGVVDVTEACDDGNRIDGDGCNAICTSREICGNGVVDTVVGEACDDGNLASHDGCDSRCALETEQWTLQGVAPSRFSTGWAAYDTTRHELIHRGNRGTWRLVGDRWELVTLEGTLNYEWHQLVWAPNLGKIVYLSYSTTELWDGASWQTIGPGTGTGTGPGAVQDAYAIYYPPTQSILLLAMPLFGGPPTPTLWSLDLATKQWTQIAMPARTVQYGGVIAYDSARNRVVVVLSGNGASPAPDTFEWDGTSWVDKGAALNGAYGWSLIDDPIDGGVVALGGANSGSPFNGASLWNGNSWQPLAAPMPNALQSTEAVLDPDTQTLVVVGGLAMVARDAVFRRTLLKQWTTPATAFPPYDPNGQPECAYDTRRNRIVRYSTFGSWSQATGVRYTWFLDTAGWHHDMSTTPNQGANGNFVYDPIRDAVLLIEMTQTFRIEDETWSADILPGPSQSVVATVFDPVRKGIVVVTANSQNDGGTWFLPSDGRAWNRIADTPLTSTYYISLAYDARRNALLLHDDNLGKTFELTADNLWSQTLSPGIGHRAVANLRRGSVELVALDGSKSWERTDGAWAEHATSPYFLHNVVVVAHAEQSELVLLGDMDDARLVARRHAISSIPDESCAPGEDLDGDGLSRCADADCWTTCSPACPPFASCL